MIKKVSMKKGVKSNNFVEVINMEEKELKVMIKNLPDWAYEARRKLAETYKNYRYWVDGVRLDGLFATMKVYGGYQWIVNYLMYRDCGKGKRTQFKSKLVGALCFDSNGRIGKWCSCNFVDKKVEYVGGIDFKGVGSDEILDCFRYCNLSGWANKNIIKCKYFPMEWFEYDYDNFHGDGCYANDNYHDVNGCPDFKMSTDRINYFFKILKMYEEYPQAEFIYRLQHHDLRVWLLGNLCNAYRSEDEIANLPDYIACIRLSLKHKYVLLDPENESNKRPRGYCLDRWRYNSIKQDSWWDCIRGLKKLGKDIRNPHYFNIEPHEILTVRRRIMEEIKRLQPVEVLDKDRKKFNRLYKKYRGLEYEDDDIVIKTLDTPEDYIEESRKMHNCIESLKYYIKPNTLILCAFSNNKRMADIEFSLVDFEIKQCCGPCNKIVPEEGKIVNIINRHIDEIRRRKAS